MTALVGATVLLPAVPAGAQLSASFSSPTRAVAGAPMFVRSVTPCRPGTGFATVSILSQLDQSPGEKTSGDLAPDGSWVLTVSAPSDMAEGVTKSYYVTAECSDGSVSYGTRRLYVTGFGGGESGSGESESALTETESTAASAPVATASVAPTVKSVRAVEAQAAASSVAAPAAVAPETTTTTWVSDEAERAAEARAELAGQRKRSTGDVTLSAAPVVATAPRPTPDGGIPWWSFLLATMLAVGAVVGFGQRRRSDS